MSKDAWAPHVARRAKRWWPEALLVVLVLAAFLGCLGSVELWGKREQRAAAEAIDTVENDHWLVAEIQGRPRLEKPPLPRWSIALLMKLIGRRDEWMVRLPGAVSGALTVALIYAFGLRMRDRELALAARLSSSVRRHSSSAKCARPATIRCLRSSPRWLSTRHGARSSDAGNRRDRAMRSQCLIRGPPPRRALGYGILRCARPGLSHQGTDHRVAGGRDASTLPGVWSTAGVGAAPACLGPGMLIFAAIALRWPVAVLLQDPAAARVWALEMSEKTGLSQILEHRRHPLLVGQWPGMVLPWTLIAALAVVLPFYVLRRERVRPALGTADSGSRRSAFLWFAWWWGVGNLAVFCFWSVPKPNYYLPCLPGMALLIGAAWVELARRAAGLSAAALRPWRERYCRHSGCLFFVAAIGGPLVVRSQLALAVWPWCLAISAALAVAVALSAQCWRRGATSIALAPLAAACVIGFLVAYGRIAPRENPERGHRALALKLSEIVPAGSRTVMFFNEIDEGLWFYARGFELAPVPRSHPRYNTAFDLAHSYLTERHHSETLGDVEARRLGHEKQRFRLAGPTRPACTLLTHPRRTFTISSPRSRRPRQTVVRETGMKRNELVLLEVTGDASHRPPTASTAESHHDGDASAPERSRSANRNIRTGLAALPSAPILAISQIGMLKK